ncbi:MAG: pyridoxal phosphate-dependent aminotransferase [Candidatus Omnitrophota bacterium]
MILSRRVKAVSPSPTLAVTARAKQMKAANIDLVNFAAGEPDWDTPDVIKEAAIDAIRSGFTKYTPTSGLPELKQQICDKFKKDNNIAYKPEQVVVTCGAKHALYNILQAIADSGHEVIIPSPYWVSYPEMCLLAGAKPVFVKTSLKNNFNLTGKDLKKAITRKTKALIINSPSNPAGSVLSIDQLKDIAALCVSNNIYCISDEIYEKLIYDNLRHESIGSLSDAIYKLTFTVNGVSKTYSMTGWRIGYLAGPLDAVQAIGRLQDHSTSNPSSISQKAAIAALKLEPSFISPMVEEFQNRRDCFLKRLDKAELAYIRPRGAFYVFCNIKKTGLGSDEFCKRFLEEAKVAAIPGKGFGNDDYVRFSFATSMADIEKGLDRLEGFLKRI